MDGASGVATPGDVPEEARRQSRASAVSLLPYLAFAAGGVFFGAGVNAPVGS